jgi:hypothetical protein
MRPMYISVSSLELTRPARRSASSSVAVAKGFIRQPSCIQMVARPDA